MALSPKDNYLMMLRGEIPEYMPSFMDGHSAMWNEELLTPVSAPNGPIVTSLGVTYVGAAHMMNGAMPAPGKNLLGEDIRNWRDVIHTPDMTYFDWERYYTKKNEAMDREGKIVSVGGGDYFLTLVSFMGFENLLMNLYEEPDEIKEMLEYVSKFYMLVLEKSTYYMKPETLSFMDDDSSERAPFFSVDMYREFFKPYHKLHCDFANECGLPIEHHDCGKCESFIPDWVEMGVVSWNPAQTMNDLKAIKKNFGDRLAISGGWDMIKWNKCTDMDVLRAAVIDYVDTFAPGGRFVFAAMAGGDPGDPLAKDRMDTVNDVYQNYAKDWYKTH